MRALLLLIVVALPLACGDPATPAVDRRSLCEPSPLPLAGAPGAPTLTDVALEVQGTRVILLLTATDPQGDEDLLDVTQRVGVFPDSLCRGAPLELTDDLACSACEESFGTVVEAASDSDLFDAIAGATRWPVEVDLRDAGGATTGGQVRARVVR